MTTIRTFADRVYLGPAQGTHWLCMVPLLRPDASALRYQALAAALAAGTLRITEVSAGGSVPEVQVENAGHLPVLLLEGAALVGAKQNRVLNLSVLAPAKATTRVPVSCVEQGRWSSQGAEFREGHAAHFAGGRARKVRDVSASLALGGAPRSDQGRVWDDLACYARNFAAAAPSGAMQDIYDAVSDKAERLIQSLAPQAGQVGGAFFTRGRLLGLDAFDADGTFAGEFAKLARSYAVESVRGDLAGDAPAPGGANETGATRDLLDELRAGDWRAYPGVGLGTDLRLTTPRVAAGALVLDDELVHLAAFPAVAVPGAGDTRDVAPPMPRGGWRRS